MTAAYADPGRCAYGDSALPTDRNEWPEIAYELWALVCNSVPFEPGTADEWNAQRDRLRDRLHAALATQAGPTTEHLEAS